MNKYIKYLTVPALALIFASCADTDGNGEGEFVWEGSENPENTSYRNPVWEPSLAGGTVLKCASNFAAVSQETQWAAGLDYACPSLQSSDLMSWSSNQTAFTYREVTDETDPETGEPIVTGSYPEWITGRITNVTADFARTINGANYWMVYTTDTDNAFGAASASSGMGPYNDMGKFLDAATLGVTELKYPHLSVLQSVNYYLGYSTENGSYIQQLNLRRGQAPTLKGAATKVAGPGFKKICLFRSGNSEFYLLGTVTAADGTTEIRYGKASKVTGPYLDRKGEALTDGASDGELLVLGGEEFESPCNPMHVFESENGYCYLAYNATEIARKEMPSGFARKPLFINPVQLDEEGWFSSTIVPMKGWTTPKYQ